MLVVVIVTTDLYAAFILTLVHARGDDISRFVLAGYLVDPNGPTLGASSSASRRAALNPYLASARQLRASGTTGQADLGGL